MLMYICTVLLCRGVMALPMPPHQHMQFNPLILGVDGSCNERSAGITYMFNYAILPKG